MNTMLAYEYDVLTDGVLPDLESPHDIIGDQDAITVHKAPVTQYPNANWGFVKRERRFRSSLSPHNLTASARFYAPVFGITPQRAEQFVALLRDVIDTLGDDASPDEVYVFMRDLLAGTDDIQESRLTTITAAYYDLWEYQGQGGIILDASA